MFPADKRFCTIYGESGACSTATSSVTRRLQPAAKFIRIGNQPPQKALFVTLTEPEGLLSPKI
jgi:hypothetical protein